VRGVSSWPWSVGAVIPASNEERTIERCLRSVLSSAAQCDRCESFWVVVVADGCCDATAAIARGILKGQGEVIETTVRSPGSARRIGARAVLEHFGGLDPSRVWLANTDADTHVPENWLSTHLYLADSNAGAVAGIVELDPDELRPEVARLYQETYKLSADGTHEHVHGANLGVRADAYLDVGGWSDLQSAEDHCLWGRLTRRGWRVRSPTASVVLTSGRLQGRAQGGFAATLLRELRSRE
jgi:cellulose synthase/poly-beta-1,6-N-acetylglucosamine synthase-like glycosyltransferase